MACGIKDFSSVLLARGTMKCPRLQKLKLARKKIEEKDLFVGDFELCKFADRYTYKQLHNTLKKN